MIIGIDASRIDNAVMTGTERYALEVTRALLRYAPQHTYRLYARTPLDKGMLQAPAPEHVDIVLIRRVRLWTHIGLAREIAAHPPDALFIPAHVLPLPQAVRRTTRSVVTVHDVGYRRFPRAHPLRQRLLLEFGTALSARYASAVVVDSEATRADVQRYYRTPASRIAVAYPGLLPPVAVSEDDVNTVRAKYRWFDGHPYALFVGTMQPRKNLRRLIQAWQQLLVSLRNQPAGNLDRLPMLVIAGAPGWGGEDLPALVTRLGLGDSVRFAGYVSDAEKAVLLQGARAFAFPSLYEGFGFPVLEAQSAGVPVVCSNVSSLPEVAGAGALQVDPLDVPALAAALRECLFDVSIRESLIRAGRANVARFSWERCAGAVLAKLDGG